MRVVAALGVILLACMSLSVARGDSRIGPDYVLGPDDVIDVTVENHPQLNKTLVVLPDGKISFPGVGEVVAAGKSLKTLGAELRAALEKTRNNVDVVVSVKEVRSRQARAVGAVKTPGSFVLKPGWRLMDLVAVAGGFVAKPSLITGSLIRTNSRVIALNVLRAMAEPDTDANPVIEVDDLAIFNQVDPATRQVHVIGEVAKPGAFDLQDGTNLVSLLSQAGSPTEKAALSKSYVLRGTTKIPVDLRSILLQGKGQEALTSMVLQPGDALFIPEIIERFAVMGEVHDPGNFPVTEKREATVVSALSMAGGQSERGDVGRTAVIRMVNGKSTVIPVNVAAMLKKRDMAADVKLLPNDIVYVPARGQRGPTIGDLGGVLGPLYWLVGLLKY